MRWRDKAIAACASEKVRSTSGAIRPPHPLGAGLLLVIHASLCLLWVDDGLLRRSILVVVS